jgi:hypothetical protein
VEGRKVCKEGRKVSKEGMIGRKDSKELALTVLY